MDDGMLEQTVRCPWCAEEILAAAKKCKHCGEYLVDVPPRRDTSSRPDTEIMLPTPTEKPPAWHRTVEGGRWRCAAHNEPNCSLCMRLSPPSWSDETGGSPVPDEYLASMDQSEPAQIICPHCHVAGGVTTTQVKVKKGISGGKATAAVLTVGFSMLATGLSRKERATNLKCSHCGMNWQV
jgi:hypothetical protein